MWAQPCLVGSVNQHIVKQIAQQDLVRLGFKWHVFEVLFLERDRGQVHAQLREVEALWGQEAPASFLNVGYRERHASSPVPWTASLSDAVVTCPPCVITLSRFSFG